jgi:hypothetical protein
VQQVAQKRHRSISGSGHCYRVSYFEESGRGFRASALIPVEVGQDCDVAPCSRVGVLICPFDGLGFRVGCLAAALLGRENMEGPTVQEPILIRASLKIKFLVIGKLANNRS